MGQFFTASHGVKTSQMKASTVILAQVVFLLQDTVAEDSRVDYVSRLKRDLFRDYDKEIIPFMKTGQAVPFAAGMSMVNMDMTDAGELDFTAWMRFFWTDERLKWNPAEYGNIDALRIPGRDVWAPDMEIYNSVEYGSGYFSEQMRERSQHAIIYPSGKVLYIPPVHGKVQCDDEKFADWPWGEYECHIKLGSWTFDGNTLNMTKYENKNYIDTEDVKLASPKVVFTENSFKNEALEKKYYECCPEPYVSIFYKFKVQRKWRMTSDGKEENPTPISEFKPEL